MLKQALKKFIKENGIKKTCMLSWLSSQTICNVIKWIRPSKKTADILYRLLDLSIDERYVSNLMSRYSESEWIGMLIRTIRVNMGMDQDEFAKMLDISTRTLQRIETEHNVPNKSVCKIISKELTQFFHNKW